MKLIIKGGLATLLVSVGLCGCATPPADPLGDLKAGKLNLTCGIACSLTWSLKVPSIHALDMSEHWPELATAVMTVGYGNDLAYYYLGQAAQGLGFHPAAIGYYNYSLALAGGNDVLLKCAGIPGQTEDHCQGVDLVNSLPVLIQVSRQAIQAANAPQPAAQPDPPKPAHHVHHHVTPPVSPGTGSAFTPPPPTASPASSPAAAGGGSGFDAPPPPNP